MGIKNRVRRMAAGMLACVLLFSSLTIPVLGVGVTKRNTTRAIAIVFDNSGSMYDSGDQAWCRATYAMEVFASMLNAGDVLQIYPMWPITVGGRTYTMEDPFQITNSAQASEIRDIYTEDAGGTPIESIDCAVNGLQTVQADKKYMIVLTDGGTFSKNGNGLSTDRTKKELDNRIQAHAGKSMMIMYLGIGSSACMPNTEQSDYFVKRQAIDTADVLSTLTVMCNQIFGRDTLPESRKSGNTIEFDISMSKLIVFVQGENISNLKITGNSACQLVSTQQTKYSTKGAGDYTSVPDTSLQGMMVTYADCAAGSYTIEHTGSATSVEIYYEPDADLDFVFTDANGNNVDSNALYEGDYKVSFGMKDAKTGKLISSDLLGNTHYQGSYFVNGKESSITHDGYSGEVLVSLNMGDTFDANLTATYLSGYTISKDSSDFGWPEGGIQITARPAGELSLEISGGEDIYSLQDLEEGSPYIAKVYYEGVQLVGSELELVELKWDPETSNAEIKQKFAEDHYELSLHYKDPSTPQETVCGECTVSIHGFYSAQASSEAKTQSPLSYNIVDDSYPLEMELFVPETYIVIGKLEDSQEIVVNLKMNGAALSPEEFAAVEMQVDCGGIKHTVTASEQDSAYLIKLLPTEGIEEGKYPIKVTAKHTDHIGRETTSEDSRTVKLSGMPLWLKWLIGLLVLLILFIIIWLILHIKVFPKYLRQLTNECYMGVNGKDVTTGTTFNAKLTGKRLTVRADYNGQNVGVSLSDLKPGPNGVLCKPSHKRNIGVVKPGQINMSGEITQADINGVLYVVDKNTGKLIPEDETQRPYLLANAAMISFDGKIEDAGKTKKFHADIPLTFRK